MFHRLKCLFGFLFASLLPLEAARYAVLAGIGDYREPISKLDGPAYDVQALSKALLQRYASDNITVLLNEQATRDNILAALRGRVEALKPGDHLFFYFSGHGTSAFDTNNRALIPAIGPDSGALIPYDLTVSSINALVGSLIIGRRDLRPILSRVPAGATAFVVLDACYSENSVKSVGSLSAAGERGISLVPIVQRVSTSRQTAGRQAPSSAIPASESDDYPYTNVVAIAAASKNQTALDIGFAALRRNASTIDGNPHGALTNSFLRALAGAGDTDRNGVMGYEELFRFVRRDMEIYPHQPQLLSADDFPLNESILGSEFPASKPAPSPSSPSPPPARADARVRVVLENPSPDLKASLKSAEGIEIATGAYDLLVRPAGKTWEIYDASGVLVQRIPRGQPAALVVRLRAHGLLSRLRNWRSSTQTFNVKVDVEPLAATGYDRLRSVFRTGERVRFRIAAERPAYLLLVGINKEGRVAVLYPGPRAAEQALQPAGKSLKFVAEATPPAGSELLKLIGFSQKPERWTDWVCKTATSCPEFDPGDARMTSLMQMLDSASDSAETSLRVVTQEAN